jgi:hypothetical protein
MEIPFENDNPGIQLFNNIEDGAAPVSHGGARNRANRA